MRLCSYVVMHDTGFAPNPFWGICTLAACTPNHQGLRLKPGDWVFGNSSLETGQRLIYAMRISEVLDFDDYYKDKRFTRKRPSSGSWRKRCGDNIYFRNKAGRWMQADTFHHASSAQIAKDTRYPRVFISDYFFYFGENAPILPIEFASLIRARNGCCCNEDKEETSRAFIEWLEETYQPGLHGLPRDREQDTGASCGIIPKGHGMTRTSCQ